MRGAQAVEMEDDHMKSNTTNLHHRAMVAILVWVLFCGVGIAAIPYANAQPVAPSGFTVELYASGLDTPFMLSFDSRGNLFCGQQCAVCPY